MPGGAWSRASLQRRSILKEAVVATHDPAGPVVVAPEVPLAVVRDALGTGCRLARPDGALAWSLLVAHDKALAHRALAAGIPVVTADDEATLIARLRAFGDGALITTREAELLAWIDAIRAEEERNQRDHEQHVDERIEVLQARVDELTAYADHLNAYTENLNAHLAAVEATRAWRTARRLSAWKCAAVRLIRGHRRG